MVRMHKQFSMLAPMAGLKASVLYSYLEGKSRRFWSTPTQNAYKASDIDTASDQGFVLIEMLCALIIIGIASVAFLQISSASTSHMTSVKTEHHSFKYAQKLVDIERMKSTADFREDFGEDGSGKLNWALTVAPIEEFKESNAEQPVLAKVKVEITSNTAPKKKKLVKLETILIYGQTAQ